MDGAETSGPATSAWVALGANLGDAVAAVHAAFDALDALPGTRVEARSRLWRTRPVDAPGPDFVNAVARLRTTLAPQALLAALLAVEAAHGRLRPYAGAPRALDLDLLMHGPQGASRVDDPGPPALVLPHPRMAMRAFVLAPLADLDPALVLPGNAGTVAQALARLAGDDTHRVAAIP